MKNIIVTTDFSAPAADAAKYAVHVAKYLKSGITLCHAFMVPVDAAAAAQVVWPLYDYDSILKEASDQLEELSQSLIQQSKSLNVPNTYKPSVECITEPGQPAQLAKKLVKQKHAELVISGMSGAGAITKFFIGSTGRTLIDKASFPVMLIPAGYAFKPIQKIAFATDLSQSDIEVLHSLAGFAHYFDAELVVVHVSNGADKQDAKNTDAFLNDVTCKINYDKIYYRALDNSNVNDGLDWLTEHGWVDLLVIVHRKGNFFDRLVEGSLTKKLVGRIKIPLLVFPEGLNPVF